MTLRCGCVLLASLLCGAAHAAVVEPPRLGMRKPASSIASPEALESLARDTFERLKPLFPVGGPDPTLNLSPSERVEAKADHRGIITVTRGLLRLCANVPPGTGMPPDEVTHTRIAFVLSHELAHVTHGHAGLFGAGIEPAVEEGADTAAVGALIVADFDAERLQLKALLQGIARTRKVSDPTVRTRVRQVRNSLRVAQQYAADWRLGWLLSVSGRFEEARDFYRNFASKYPLPAAMNAFAHTRVLAAWRVHPCTHPTVLEWSVPLRYDPRSQQVPFKVRSFEDSCRAFTDEIRGAIGELKKASGYAPARVAVGALRLTLNDPSLDPTSHDGGVPRMGSPCPAPPFDAPADALLYADACQISLIAQYEMSARSATARQAAIDGLWALHARWPTEPSLQFNLARLLTHAGQAREAEALWAAFARDAAEGPYRDEARSQLQRLATSSTGTPAPDAEGTLVRAELPSKMRIVLTPTCVKPESGVIVSATPQRYLRRCGSWSDEFVVKDTRGAVLIRSVRPSSPLWSPATPPSATPLFVSHEANGDVIRVWDQEAWVFNAGAPTRVVYFKRAQ
jgi:hypothetical protein